MLLSTSHYFVNLRFLVVVGNSNKWSYYKTSFACLYLAHLRTRFFIRVTSTRLRDIFVLLGFSNATSSKISFSVDTKCYYLLRSTLFIEINVGQGLAPAVLRARFFAALENDSARRCKLLPYE